MVYIVVLHWNNYRCTDFCLQYLAQITYTLHKIVVVDNCSTDGSFERLKLKYTSCIYINNSENLGFARGTNVGLKYAYEQGADYFILLNNDVEVEPDFIEHLIEPILSLPNVGLVTPKILYRDNREVIWHAGGHIKHSTITGVSRGYDEFDIGQYDEIIETQWASGACCLIKRDAINKIGFLEERYFFGQEEWDYSTTAMRNNFKIIYTHKAVVYHEIAKSTIKSPGLSAYQNIFNKCVYASKFLSKFQFLIWVLVYYLYLIFFFPPRNLPHTSYTSFYLRSAKLAALWGIRDFFRGKKITADRIVIINKRLELKYKTND